MSEQEQEAKRPDAAARIREESDALRTWLHGVDYKPVSDDEVRDAAKREQAERLVRARRTVPEAFAFVTATPEPPKVLRFKLPPGERFIEAMILGRCLTITGPSGTGKTTLAVWIVRHLFKMGADPFSPVAERAARARFIPCRDLVAPPDSDYGGMIHEAMRAPLIVLDDVGLPTCDRGATMRALEHRYDRRMTTIVTTGLTREQFADSLGDGVARRYWDVAGLPDVYVLDARYPDEPSLRARMIKAQREAKP